MAQRTCSIDGCEHDRYCRGWCKSHYDRWWRTGTPDGPPVKRRNNAQRLQWIVDLCNEAGGEGCRDWPWIVRTARRPTGEYPVVYKGVVSYLVTALVLEATVGPRPDGYYALHSCDRKVCCAPWHLRWGTPSENNRESWERIRGPRLRGEIP